MQLLLRFLGEFIAPSVFGVGDQSDEQVVHGLTVKANVVEEALLFRVPEAGAGDQPGERIVRRQELLLGPLLVIRDINKDKLVQVGDRTPDLTCDAPVCPGRFTGPIGVDKGHADNPTTTGANGVAQVNFTVSNTIGATCTITATIPGGLSGTSGTITTQ